MRRFRFGLKRLETLRDVRRRQARAVLAEALGRVRDMVREREEHERVLAESLAVDPPVSGPLDPAATKAAAEWQDGLRQVLRCAAALEQQARERARQAGDRHTSAARDHRVLERLRERQHMRWLHEAELEDRKFLDEIHSTTRRRKAGGDDA